MFIDIEFMQKLDNLSVDEAAKLLDDKLIEVMQRATEEALKVLPFIINSLITQIGSAREISLQFYKDNPQFEKHKAIVAACVEEFEANNPGKKMEDILKESLPTIQSRIKNLPNMEQELKRPDVNKMDFGAL